MSKELSEALEKCQTVFAEYAEMHRRKLKNPMNAAELSSVHMKIERNRDMSDMCLDILSRARSADEQPAWGAEIAARHEFGDMDNEAASARISAGDKDRENPVERPGNVETATPPDDLVEVVARAIWIGSGKRADLWDNPPSPAWAAEMHQRKPGFIRTAQAVLQALSPHLSEREKIVAWLLDVAGQFPTHPLLHFIGDPWTDDGKHLARDIADAISRGDHISGEGR